MFFLYVVVDLTNFLVMFIMYIYDHETLLTVQKIMCVYLFQECTERVRGPENPEYHSGINVSTFLKVFFLCIIFVL